MESVLSNPATLTPLALAGLVIVQIMQMFRAHLDSKAGRIAKVDDSLAAILQRVMDQHAAASDRHAAAMERVGGALSEVQAHMRDTNAVLSTFSHRLEAVEVQLAAQTPRTRSTKAA